MYILLLWSGINNFESQLDPDGKSTRFFIWHEESAKTAAQVKLGSYLLLLTEYYRNRRPSVGIPYSSLGLPHYPEGIPARPRSVPAMTALKLQFTGWLPFCCNTQAS